jgi:hypothetical protein
MGQMGYELTIPGHIQDSMLPWSIQSHSWMMIPTHEHYPQRCHQTWFKPGKSLNQMEVYDWKNHRTMAGMCSNCHG